MSLPGVHILWISNLSCAGSIPKTGQVEELEILDIMSHILGRGDSTQSAHMASRRLIKYFGSPHSLAGASMEEIRLAGKISNRQAACVFYALQLGKQVCTAPLQPGERFSNSRELFQRYRARFYSATREFFLSLHLNAKNRLIREVLVSIGSLSTSIVHPREVYSPAVKDSTAALIFLHNHPSGDPSPSREDRECTRRLIHAGHILGIRVLDHIVFGRDDYFSFADAGQLEATEEGSWARINNICP